MQRSADQVGATPGDEPPEWELFDCDAYLVELHNCADDPNYAEIFLDMLEKRDPR